MSFKDPQRLEYKVVNMLKDLPISSIYGPHLTLTL